MEIKKTGQSGTLESSDILITVNPCAKGIEIELQSSVMKQFGTQIKQVIQDTLAKHSIDHVHVVAIDKGALDCTIRARLKAAIMNAQEVNL